MPCPQAHEPWLSRLSLLWKSRRFWEPMSQERGGRERPGVSRSPAPGGPPREGLDRLRGGSLASSSCRREGIWGEEKLRGGYFCRRKHESGRPEGSRAQPAPGAGALRGIFRQLLPGSAVPRGCGFPPAPVG